MDGFGLTWTLMKLKAVRGTHDLFGAEISRWHHVETVIRACLESFGYQEIRTPVLEQMEVFSQSVGEDTDIVEKQMYYVDDKSSGRLVLRPEGTAAFVRSVVEHQLHRTGNPGRYFYYLSMFRHERPQKGRLRQFHQFGAEFINSDAPEADAELIVLLDQIYQKFGLTQYEVRINSLGNPECRQRYRELPLS